MTDHLDKQIREALGDSDARIFDEYNSEQSIPEVLISVFHGRNLLLKIAMSVCSLLAFVFAIYCTVHFFRAEALDVKLGWAVGIIIGLMMTMSIKIWFWMEMQRNTLTREVKRVELQVARLARRLEESPSPHKP